MKTAVNILRETVMGFNGLEVALLVGLSFAVLALIALIQQDRKMPKLTSRPTACSDSDCECKMAGMS